MAIKALETTDETTDPQLMKVKSNELEIIPSNHKKLKQLKASKSRSHVCLLGLENEVDEDDKLCFSDFKSIHRIKRKRSASPIVSPHKTILRQKSGI